ncbi:hypothetical protein L6452_15058 [Arctium lappa]|uniref:Uncharacterized protein n=1 Tax=Arctium lappa TaxID=4217 RepID=A0ACB9CNA4_ARCLA|nr:hypothetical protein L6452_15058 [Arctium lappa]
MYQDNIYDLDEMIRELDDCRRRANIVSETADGLKQINSQIFAERDKLKNQVFSLEVELNMLKEKDNSKDKEDTKKAEKKRKDLENENAELTKNKLELEVQIEKEKKERESYEKKRKEFENENAELKKKISEFDKERKDFAKKFSDFSRKAFEEKKVVEMKCIKLSQQVSDFEKVIILERDKFEKEQKKIVETKTVKKDFTKEKIVFETEIAKLTKKLYELSSTILKEKNAKAELHKKFDILSNERNCLTSKIKELEEIMFTVKLTEHKTPESIGQSPRDDQAGSECSFKTTSSSNFMNVSHNPLFDSDDSHTSALKDNICPSNLFYEKNVDGSGNIQKKESQKKMTWRKKDEKDKENWYWRVKGSSEEKKKEEISFGYTFKAQRNNSPKGGVKDSDLQLAEVCNCISGRLTSSSIRDPNTWDLITNAAALLDL